MAAERPPLPADEAERVITASEVCVIFRFDQSYLQSFAPEPSQSLLRRYDPHLSPSSPSSGRQAWMVMRRRVSRYALCHKCFPLRRHPGHGPPHLRLHDGD
jgi:hypothetical protein